MIYGLARVSYRRYALSKRQLEVLYTSEIRDLFELYRVKFVDRPKAGVEAGQSIKFFHLQCEVEKRRVYLWRSVGADIEELGYSTLRAMLIHELAHIVTTPPGMNISHVDETVLLFSMEQILDQVAGVRISPDHITLDPGETVELRKGRALAYRLGLIDRQARLLNPLASWSALDTNTLRRFYVKQSRNSDHTRAKEDRLFHEMLTKGAASWTTPARKTKCLRRSLRP